MLNLILVSLMNDDWCWKEKVKDVEVVDQDVSEVTFSQSGFSLTCSLSHSVKLVNKKMFFEYFYYFYIIFLLQKS